MPASFSQQRTLEVRPEAASVWNLVASHLWQRKANADAHSHAFLK